MGIEAMESDTMTRSASETICGNDAGRDRGRHHDKSEFTAGTEEQGRLEAGGTLDRE